MSKKLSLIVCICLSIYATTDCLLLSRLVDRNESTDCPTLCDDGLHIDAITSINLTPELLLISGVCAFIVDPNHQNVGQSRHGFKHLLKFSEIQDMFAIGNKTDIEFVSIYASGTMVEVIAANSTDLTADFSGSNVFEGLSVELGVPIDAAFAWTDKRIVYLIQGSQYWAYEMTRGWRSGGKQLEDYPRNITDFGLNPDHRITSAFSDENKIYFLSLDLVHVFLISDVDSKTGLFKGSLQQKSIKLKEFLNCPIPEVSNESEVSGDWMVTISGFIVQIKDTIDQNFELIWLMTALVVLIVSLLLLVMTLVRYFQVICVTQSKDIEN